MSSHKLVLLVQRISAGQFRWRAKYSEECDLVTFLVDLPNVQFLIFVDAGINSVRLEALGSAAFHHVNYLDSSGAAEHCHHVFDGRIDLVSHVLWPEFHITKTQACKQNQSQELQYWSVYWHWTAHILAAVSLASGLRASKRMRLTEWLWLTEVSLLSSTLTPLATWQEWIKPSNYTQNHFSVTQFSTTFM